MANARVGTLLFDIDPTTASWSYRLRTSSTDTYGGRVVQILGCSVENFTVGGYLRPPKGGSDGLKWNRFVEMERFERKVKSLMERQAETKQPSDFVFPPLGWGTEKPIKVYLTGYNSVRYDVSSAAVSYNLTFDVDSGFDEVVKSDMTYGLDQIPQGVAWVRNKYNTSTRTWEEVKDALEKTLDAAGQGDLDASLYEYLEPNGEGDEGYESQVSDGVQSTTPNPEASGSWVDIYGDENASLADKTWAAKPISQDTGQSSRGSGTTPSSVTDRRLGRY